MKRDLAVFGLTMVYDETMDLVLVKDGGNIIDCRPAKSRKEAKKAMSQLEQEYHSWARGMEA